MDYWRELAAEAGLPGLHLVATLDFHDCNWDAAAHGYDAVTVWTLGRVTKESTPSRFMARWKSRLQRGLPRPLHPLVEKISSGLDYVYDYGEVRGQLVYENQFNLPYHPMIVLHSFQRIAQVEPEFFGIRTMWNSCPFAITALVSQLGTFRRRGGLFF